jgi:hypothetical protein
MKFRNINLLAALACFVCAVGYTVAGKPPSTVVTLVLLGLANIGFVLVRDRSR